MNDRETQINALAAAIYIGTPKLEHAHKEAERYIARAEQRVRAELSAQIEQQEETIKALQDDLSAALAQIAELTL